MLKSFIVFVLAFVGVFIIDQNIKTIFLDGFRWYGDYFSLILTYNKGVAFSMLAFLEGNLKYLQLLLISSVVIYLGFNRNIFKPYCLPSGLLLGAGSSNLYDRFIHGGVVDYVYWHKWFEFAVFNFADVMVNFSVILILIISLKKNKKI
ncbi:signal peptidase II [Sulfurospirillum arcachonense]|uniref:signal peptidase II n=1 Tax=Sulfurospirillum arcachonense TaxID=57666 RepID=UPI00046840BD|nr:signal peptidase II [Sulfurospirillum arcachonense]